MHLRKEIEKLIYWYVPAYIISITLGWFLVEYMKATEESARIIAYVIFPLGFFISYLHNIVIAIWLYNISKQSNQKYKLWALFGLVAHLYALVIFIIINFIEGKLDFDKENTLEKTINNQ
ncbi:hypothetical protein [uncultured Sulfurimonas sp.]|jgi:hypothetical protein|uniref:hypothetical protein n=2 Tax=Sulfurimonas TaxID=202746 RepID=UPI0032B20FD8|nr:hypothetical protein [Sulfurimonas sp.]